MRSSLRRDCQIHCLFLQPNYGGPSGKPLVSQGKYYVPPYCIYTFLYLLQGFIPIKMGADQRTDLLAD